MNTIREFTRKKLTLNQANKRCKSNGRTFPGRNNTKRQKSMDLKNISYYIKRSKMKKFKYKTDRTNIASRKKRPIEQKSLTRKSAKATGEMLPAIRSKSREKMTHRSYKRQFAKIDQNRRKDKSKSRSIRARMTVKTPSKWQSPFCKTAKTVKAFHDLYQMVKILGNGSNSEVYLYRHRKSKSLVAVKKFNKVKLARKNQLRNLKVRLIKE